MLQTFATSSPYPQITFAEAWQRIAQQLAPLPAQDVPLAEAGNLVLARDLVAAVDVPAFAAATMDGYAVRTADAGAGEGLVARRVTGEGLAGADAVTPLLAGECRRIMTGAPLPPGADAVIPVEETSEVDGVMYSRARPAPRANVRAIGSDVARGAQVLSVGTLLGPAEIGLLATLGLAAAPVHPRPRVLVLATGDELVPPGQPLAPGQVYDSNSVALAEAIRQVDCLGERRQPALDDAGAIEGALREAVACADLVLTTGGVSMGTRDLLKPALERLGTVHFGRVATKPGKPVTFATIDGVPVLALPGNPVSSLVAFEMYARPALRLLGGKRPLWRPAVQVRLQHALKQDPERLDWQRAVVTREADGGYVARTTGAQASSRLLSLVGANGLLCVPPGQGTLAAGARVACILLHEPETAEVPW